MNYRKNIVASSNSGFVKQTFEISYAFSIKKTGQVESVEDSMSCVAACGKTSVRHAQRGTVLGVTLPFSTPEK